MLTTTISDAACLCRRNQDLRENVERACLQANEVVRIDRLNSIRRLVIAKKIADRIVAALALIFFAPLILAVAILIKIDSPGPILFRQKRTGYLGRRFTLYKLRTMHRDAEQQKAPLRNRNIFGENSPDFKLRSDPRVTRLGRILRKTSIDEIPNLINVVTGDMSLVGPRPTSFPIETYSPEHFYRLAVRPGITGLWQVSGRAEVGFDERVRLDVEYINSMSFHTDLKIIILTIMQVVRPVGAY